MGRKSVRYEDFRAQRLADAEVRAEYEALEPEFKLIRSILLLRSQQNISQAQLAKLIGTRQPAISRLESSGGNITIDTLCRIADALNADLDISLKPRTDIKVATVQPSR